MEKYVIILPGWKLVPIAPDDKMISKAYRPDRYGYGFVSQHAGCDIYRTMLEVSPEPPEPPIELKRTLECAKRLVEHADYRLGGILSADSKAKEIPSRATSQVKARHLAALGDAIKAYELISGNIET